MFDLNKKKWIGTRRRLLEGGYAESFHAQLERSQKPVRCLRLLKPYVESEGTRRTFQAKGRAVTQMVEVPIEIQLYRLIEASGVEGIAQPVTSTCNRSQCENLLPWNMNY
jgi:hypothetical protein